MWQALIPPVSCTYGTRRPIPATGPNEIDATHMSHWSIFPATKKATANQLDNKNKGRRTVWNTGYNNCRSETPTTVGRSPFFVPNMSQICKRVVADVQKTEKKFYHDVEKSKHIGVGAFVPPWLMQCNLHILKQCPPWVVLKEPDQPIAEATVPLVMKIISTGRHEMVIFWLMEPWNMAAPMICHLVCIFNTVNSWIYSN